MTVSDQAIADAIMTLCAERGPDKTICPSEAARLLARSDQAADAWRPLMDDVRRIGRLLADSDRIVVLQKGQRVDPHDARGAIRYRIAKPR